MIKSIDVFYFFNNVTAHRAFSGKRKRLMSLFTKFYSVIVVLVYLSATGQFRKVMDGHFLGAYGLS